MVSPVEIPNLSLSPDLLKKMSPPLLTSKTRSEAGLGLTVVPLTARIVSPSSPTVIVNPWSSS